ncbi:MAG TPA: hypothetical protein VFX85_06425 [Solirubrobacterales bacterium]|nr:hypothetical protein [Solirubrobacterales bacterium]
MRAFLCAFVVCFIVLGITAPAASAVSDLTIAKSDNPDPVVVGATLTYVVQVQNLGPDPATGVKVTDHLPQGVDLVSATGPAGSCAQKGRNLSCDLGALPAPTVNYGGPPTVTIAVIPRRTGTVTNTATVRGAQKDPVSANNRASITTSVLGPSVPVTCRGVAVTIAGTAGDDTIVGTGGRDVIATFGGNDAIFALAGRDLVCAGGGSDFVGAGTAADRVFGGTGRDRIRGAGGPDLLRGNAGNDVLKGNRGADRLRGGSGTDTCRGGPGANSVRGCER